MYCGMNIFTMKPLVPEEAVVELDDGAFALVADANRLESRVHPLVQQAVCGLVRSMNCCYLNLTEGHDTHPRSVDTMSKLGGMSPNDKISRFFTRIDKAYTAPHLSNLRKIRTVETAHHRFLSIPPLPRRQLARRWVHVPCPTQATGRMYKLLVGRTQGLPGHKPPTRSC